MQLFHMIFKKGFDSHEADTNGVVVAQRPGCTNISDFNRKAAEGTPFSHPR